MFAFKTRWLDLSVVPFALLYLFPSLALAHGISDADKQRMLEGGYLQKERITFKK